MQSHPNLSQTEKPFAQPHARGPQAVRQAHQQERDVRAHQGDLHKLRHCGRGRDPRRPWLQPGMRRYAASMFFCVKEEH